jgi:multiple antibiotic resistance protein
MPTSLLEQFVTLWVVIDPIGTVPVFIGVTVGLSAQQRRAVAIKAVAVAAGMLLFFLIAGQRLLKQLGISLDSFRISGGIILFLFALTMIFGESKPASELAATPVEPRDIAVFPLGVPSIAGPGSMIAIVVLTDNHRYTAGQQEITALVMLAVLACTLALLLAAGPINRLLGLSGASIVSRMMGMILAALAIDSVLEALSAHFSLPH